MQFNKNMCTTGTVHEKIRKYNECHPGTDNDILSSMQSLKKVYV